MKWYIICYLFGCAIAFPLGMYYQMCQDQKEIGTAQINAKKGEETYKARLIACESDIKSTTIVRNFYKTELDSIKNYDDQLGVNKAGKIVLLDYVLTKSALCLLR